MTDAAPLPVLGVRLAEGRSGSTLLMQLLATGPGVVFDRRYPAEYRFLSYFARTAAMLTEPFDEERHVGVTPFFFGDRPQWGPIPFATDLVDVGRLERPILRHLWLAWSEEIRRSQPDATVYAEKLAVDVPTVAAAGVPIRVIDLVRDPRDVVASIRAFTATGMDGFGRHPGIDERRFLGDFLRRYGAGLAAMADPLPDGIDRILVRYEDLARDLTVEADRLGDWAGLDLDAAPVEHSRDAYRHHRTTDTVEESIGRWRRDLLPGEADLIADRLAEQLRPFGYDLDQR